MRREFHQDKEVSFWKKGPMRRRFYYEKKFLLGEGSLLWKSKFYYEKKILLCDYENRIKHVTLKIQKTL